MEETIADAHHRRSPSLAAAVSKIVNRKYYVTQAHTRIIMSCITSELQAHTRIIISCIISELKVNFETQ